MSALRIAALALLLGCGSGSTHPTMTDPDASTPDSATPPSLHDQLTDCPGWTSVQLHPAFCERACVPKPTTFGSQCAGATNPTTTDMQTCSPSTQVDGVNGCCVMAFNPYRVLFYECPVK